MGKFYEFGSILDIHSSRLCECKEPARRRLVKANVGGLYLCHEGDVSGLRRSMCGGRKEELEDFSNHSSSTKINSRGGSKRPIKVCDFLSEDGDSPRWTMASKNELKVSSHVI
jgi:hypothetical protein